MTLHMPAPLHLPAEPIALSSARRVRPARIIRTGERERAATVRIAYTQDDIASAWYAELRAKQAVR